METGLFAHPYVKPKTTAMPYSLRLLVCCVFALFLTSCGSDAGWGGDRSANENSKTVAVNGFFMDQAEISNNEYRRMTDSVRAASGQTPPPPPAPATTQPQDIPLKAQVKNPEMIIKTGSMDIQVDDYSKAMPAISALVKSNNGYVQSENESTDNWAKRNQITIRVPANNFEKLMNSIGGIARNVLSRNVNTDDVTQEYFDTEARKKSQQAAADRYIELLKQAKNVEEVMAVQSRIDMIQEEIDAKEGRMRYLRDQVGYSTITLSVSQNYDYKPTEGPGFGSRMGNAFGNGWQGFLQFLIIVVNLWPLWIILGIVFIVVRKLVKRLLKKKA